MCLLAPNGKKRHSNPNLRIKPSGGREGNTIICYKMWGASSLSGNGCVPEPAECRSISDLIGIASPSTTMLLERSMPGNLDRFFLKNLVGKKVGFFLVG